LNQDFLDLLSALLAANARFLVVGGYAVGIHGHPRATKDLDIWVDPTEENARQVFSALQDFGAPLGTLTIEDLARPGTGFMMGRPPQRIDILTQIPGVSFGVAYDHRLEVPVADAVRCPFIGLDDLIANKRAAGRPQDLVDAAVLDRIRNRGR
jgi:hypothetical protein